MAVYIIQKDLNCLIIIQSSILRAEERSKVGSIEMQMELLSEIIKDFLFAEIARELIYSKHKTDYSISSVFH